LNNNSEIYFKFPSTFLDLPAVKFDNLKKKVKYQHT